MQIHTICVNVINFSVNDPICYAYRFHMCFVYKETVYIWECCKGIAPCRVLKAVEWGPWEICFNGNVTGKYKLSAGTGSELRQSQVTCQL